MKNAVLRTFSNTKDCTYQLVKVPDDWDGIAYRHLPFTVGVTQDVTPVSAWHSFGPSSKDVDIEELPDGRAFFVRTVVGDLGFGVLAHKVILADTEAELAHDSLGYYADLDESSIYFALSPTSTQDCAIFWDSTDEALVNFLIKETT
jgi:hypothetical protein